MLTNGAFTALILIICGHFSDAAVPPPSNVMVKCENLKTTVSWDYSEPQTIFWVNVTGSSDVGSFEASTAGHQYDLSRLVLGSNERYLSFLVVFVTAVQGGEKSEAVKSKSFSFNQLVAVDIKCSLDFPPVKVHKTEYGASVQFANPLHFYDELKRTVPPNSKAAFRYSVSSSANTFNGLCSGSDLTCKLDVTLSADGCVNLTGHLCFEELCVKQMAFKETKKYCSEKQEVDGPIMFAIILGSIFLIIIIVAAVVVCKVQAWTMKIPMPNIQVNLHRNSEQKSFFIPHVNPENSQVSIVSPPVETTSLVSEDSSCCEQPELNGGDHYECRAEQNYAGGGCLEDSIPNLDMEGFVSGANGTDDSPDSSVKTECTSLSSTEDSSPYDRPHVHFKRDLGDGEPVIGYGGN